jgi:hypothetical protein
MRRLAASRLRPAPPRGKSRGVAVSHGHTQARQTGEQHAMGFVGELGGIGDQEHRTVCARATTTQPASAPAVVEIVVRRRLCQRAFLFRGTTLPGGRFSRSDGRLQRRRGTGKSTGKSTGKKAESFS